MIISMIITKGLVVLSLEEERPRRPSNRKKAALRSRSVTLCMY